MGLFIMLDPETTVALKVEYQTSVDDFLQEDQFKTGYDSRCLCERRPGEAVFVGTVLTARYSIICLR